MKTKIIGLVIILLSAQWSFVLLNVNFRANNVSPLVYAEGRVTLRLNARNAQNMANAHYKATGKRFYHQLFIKNNFDS